MTMYGIMSTKGSTQMIDASYHFDSLASMMHKRIDLKYLAAMHRTMEWQYHQFLWVKVCSTGQVVSMEANTQNNG